MVLSLAEGHRAHLSSLSYGVAQGPLVQRVFALKCACYGASKSTKSHPIETPMGETDFLPRLVLTCRGAAPVKTSTGKNFRQRPHLVGTFLGFKMSKCRGREEKQRQKKAERRKKKKLGNMKNPHVFVGVFSWPIFTIKLGKNLFFWPKCAHQLGSPPNFPRKCQRIPRSDFQYWC